MSTTSNSIPEDVRSAANRKVTELFHRIWISQAIVSSALEIPKVSSAFKQQIVHSHLTGETGIKELLSRFIEPFEPEKDLPMMVQMLAEQAAINSEMVISAAAIVLSHSTADDVFTAACELAVDLAPNEWISELNMDKKVTLRSVKEKGPEALFASELGSFRAQLSRKSLPNRASLLFRHVKLCQRKDTVRTDPTYFQLPTLKQADDLRVKIIHGTGLPPIPLDHSFNVMLFLHEAAQTALRSVGTALELRLDIPHLMQLKTSGSARSMSEAP